MSDFLTRLAARQLGQIETIEPRVRPLYAEPSLASPASSVPGEIAETVAFQPNRSDPPIPPPPTLGSILRSPRSETDEARQNPIVPRVRSGAASPAAELPFDESTRAKRSVPRPAETKPAESAADRASPTLPRLMTAPVPLPARNRESPHVSASVVVTPAPLWPAPDTDSERGPFLHAEISRTRGPQRDQELRAPASLPAPEIRAERLQKPLTQAPVRVTIGRIEVTAVPEAGPPRRVPAARKPRVSLDAYLERRQGSQVRDR